MAEHQSWWVDLHHSSPRPIYHYLCLWVASPNTNALIHAHTPSLSHLHVSIMLFFYSLYFYKTIHFYIYYLNLTTSESNPWYIKQYFHLKVRLFFYGGQVWRFSTNLFLSSNPVFCTSVNTEDILFFKKPIRNTLFIWKSGWIIY